MQASLHILEPTSASFYAAMAVLFGHFAGYLDLAKTVATALAGGYGVSFFFVLSGFILCYRYWNKTAWDISAEFASYAPCPLILAALARPAEALGLK